MGILIPSMTYPILTTKVNQNHVPIDIMYHGSTISVKGLVSSDHDLIVKITSPVKTESFNKTEKIAHAFWMSNGQVKVRNTNPLYMVYSTKPLNKILSQDDRNKYSLGYSAVKKNMQVESDQNKEDWKEEFIKYKEQNHLYERNRNNGVFKISHKSSETDDYVTNIPWPYQATPGVYNVTVYSVKDHHIDETASGTCTVEQVGIVNYISEMAIKNALLYGTLAVVISLILGLGVGFVLNKR